MEFLKSFQYIKHKNIKLLIVGSAFYGMNIKTRFEKDVNNLIKKIENNVVFTGFVPYGEMYKIYNLADIVVLPSMWEEPAGLTIIEAMACEKPVITTCSGGIPEYANEDSAIFLNRDDKISINIAEKIDYLINHSEICYKLGKNGRERVEKNFNHINYIDNFLKLL